jgi:hypothetical protein
MALTLPFIRLTTWPPHQLHLQHQWVKDFLLKLAYTFHSKTVRQQHEKLNHAISNSSFGQCIPGLRCVPQSLKVNAGAVP